jgi:uncharacterized protein YgbK (DUF1537 family)
LRYSEGNKPLYAFYGDDFTGSTDVLESLALHGLPAVLFPHPPEQRELAAFAHCRAFGIAGESRSRSPQWMDDNLPAIFANLKSLGAPINHYKVCSTFDSAPEMGSIGRAMELGREAFTSGFVPVVVAAPHLGRSVVFGNLFADAGGVMYRIDRHPTMSRHPITPMHEADLRRHLARQTSLSVELVDLKAFQQSAIREQLQARLAAGAEVVLFDGCADAMLDETARLLWEQAVERPMFAVGSSGLTYGLLRHWRQTGLIEASPVYQRPAAADRLLVLSGSCSPVTEMQIRCAQQRGFAAWHLQNGSWDEQIRQATEALASGRSVVLYTALGPQAGPQAGKAEYGEQYSAALGRELRKLLMLSGVRRVLIAGGDTSTHTVRQLGLDALTFAAPLTPGAPLCKGHAAGSPLDGLEIVLKGGQIGPADFFAQVRDGQ